MEQLWSLFEQFHLSENMRLSSSGQDQKDFATYLLSVGDGKVTDALPNELPMAAETKIPLREELRSSSESTQEFCKEIFPNLGSIVLNGEQSGDKEWYQYLMERAIICPTNKEVDTINNIMIDNFPGEVRGYRSYDKLLEESQAHSHSFPVEYLNTVNVNGVPAHYIKLKKGAPIMLLRNLDPARGHVNGTRYIIRSLHRHVIYAEIAVGPYKGNDIMIPRILFHPKDRSLPISMERRQFPVRLCFSVTSNKSQGQTLKHVGIYLKQVCSLSNDSF